MHNDVDELEDRAVASSWIAEMLVESSWGVARFNAGTLNILKASELSI